MLILSVLYIVPIVFRLSLSSKIFILPFSIILSMSVNQINHNHCHVSIFTVPFLNRFVDFWISILRGGPCSLIVYIHNMNHHLFLPSKKDVFHISNSRRKNRLVNLLSYTYVTMLRFKKKWKKNKLLLPAKLVKNVQNEMIVSYSTLIFVFIYDPLNAIIFILFPMMAGNTFLVFSNLIQHENCDLKSKYNFSRNFVSKIENFIFFNGGFHTAHHLAPTIHWSELPMKHRKIKENIDNNLLQNSFFGYTFNSFFRKNSGQIND